MSEIIIRGGTILTVDDQSRVLTGDVACVDGRFVQVGGSYTPTTRDYEILEADGCVVMPGLIQSHIHMCQNARPRLGRWPASFGMASQSGLALRRGHE